MERCLSCSGGNIEVLNEHHGFALAATHQCRDCGARYVPPSSRAFYCWVFPAGLVVLALGIVTAWLLLYATYHLIAAAGSSATGPIPTVRGAIVAGLLLIAGVGITREGWKILTGRSGRILTTGLPPGPDEIASRPHPPAADEPSGRRE